MVELQGVGRRAADDSQWLLRDVSLSLAAGERLALSGASGSGKTLLLRAIALLDPIDAGTIRWQGLPIADRDVPAYRRQVVYLHQRPVLFEGTVEENLTAALRLKARRGHAFDRPAALERLTRLGRTESFLKKPSSELSGGEAQIVALVRALSLDASVLLLDESTSALDAKTAAAAQALLADWIAQRPQSRALVWVSHDAERAQPLATRGVVLRGGAMAG